MYVEIEGYEKEAMAHHRRQELMNARRANSKVVNELPELFQQLHLRRTRSQNIERWIEETTDADDVASSRTVT